MVKNRTTSYGLMALALAALVSSCGDSSSPTSPSAMPTASGLLTALAPDGVISLKTPAPVLQSPPNNSETVGLTPVLTTNNSQPDFVPSADFTYDFELYQVLSGGGMQQVGTTRSVEQTAGTTSYPVTEPLEQTMTYMWRSRARIGDEHGPWSSVWTFTTPTLVTVDAPTPLTPADASTTSSLSPDLVVTNGAVENAGTVTYEFQVDVAATFPSPFRVIVVARGTGTTTASVGEPLGLATVYFWRVRGSNGTITSGWSATFTFTTPDIRVDAPTLVSPADGSTTTTFSPDLVVTNGTVSAGAGPVQYEFWIGDEGPTFPNPSSFLVGLGGGTTTGNFGSPLAPLTQFWWRVRGKTATFTGAWSATFTFVTPSVSAGNRTPDPPPGQSLPLPNREQLIIDLANQHPGAINDSCQEDGGTWEFMDLVMERLRMEDTRWGFNCKRGNCNDVSLDVVVYFWGIGDGQGSTQVYIIDMIGGHCGPGPDAAWQDVTDETHDAGTTGGFVYPR
jgi:hypothetical protein